MRSREWGGAALAKYLPMLRTNMLVLAVAISTVALPAFAKKPAPPPPEATGPVFDRHAAASALSQVSILPCKQSKGPSGDGHIVVTFAPTGDVQEAVVDRDPVQEHGRRSLYRDAVQAHARSEVHRRAGHRRQDVSTSIDANRASDRD